MITEGAHLLSSPTLATASNRSRLRAVSRSVIVAAGFLSACGGNGDTGSPAEPLPAQVASTSAQVRIDPAIPMAVASSIAEVTSSVDSKPAGSALKVRSQTDSAEMILALDSRGRIVLAGVARGGDATLSANTTARALVRIALGATFDSVAASEVDAAIQASTAFPRLVASIDAALVGQRLTSTDAETLAGIAAVLKTLPASSLAAASNGAGGRESTAALPDPKVDKPTPFRIFRDIFQIFGEPLVVYVNDGPNVGEVALQNATTIEWSVRTAAHDGRKLTFSELPLPATTLKSVLLGIALPWVPVEKIKIPTDAGRGFLLTVEQTDRSREANVTQIGYEIIASLIDLYPTGSKACAKTIAKQVFSRRAQALAAEPSVDAFLDSFVDFPIGVLDVVEVVEVCARYRPVDVKAGDFNATLTKQIKAVGQFVKAYVRPLQALETLTDYVSLGSKVLLFWAYRDDTYPVSVCEGRTTPSTSSASRISNCTAKFKLDEDITHLAIGAKAKMPLNALDIADVATLLPRALVFERQGGLDATTPFKFDTRTLEAEGTADGLSAVSVLDEATGVDIVWGLKVSEPQIAPQNPAIVEGELTSFKLESRDGTPIKLPAQVEYSSSDETVLEQVQSTSLFAGRKPGKSVVTAFVPSSNLSYKTEVTVLAKPPQEPPELPRGTVIGTLVLANYQGSDLQRTVQFQQDGTTVLFAELLQIAGCNTSMLVAECFEGDYGARGFSSVDISATGDVVGGTPIGRIVQNADVSLGSVSISSGGTIDHSANLVQPGSTLNLTAKRITGGLSLGLFNCTGDPKCDSYQRAPTSINLSASDGPIDFSIQKPSALLNVSVSCSGPGPFNVVVGGQRVC